MKNVIIIMGVMLSLFSLSVSASEKVTRADVHRLNQGSVGEQIERSPILLPDIYIIVDSNARTLKIDSSAKCDATIYVYDNFGDIIELSDSLDSILIIPEVGSSIYDVRIVSDYWYATAKIRI